MGLARDSTESWGTAAHAFCVVPKRCSLTRVVDLEYSDWQCEGQGNTPFLDPAVCHAVFPSVQVQLMEVSGPGQTDYTSAPFFTFDRREQRSLKGFIS